MGFIQNNLPEILQIGGCLTSLTGTALMPRATRKYIKMEEKGFETNGDQVKALVKCYALPVGLSLSGTTATLTGCYIQHENVKSLRGEVAIATSAATTAAQIANGYRNYISEKEGPEKAKEVHEDIVKKSTPKKDEIVPYTSDEPLQGVNLLKVYPCRDSLGTEWYSSINQFLLARALIDSRLASGERYMSMYECYQYLQADVDDKKAQFEAIGVNMYDMPVLMVDIENILRVDSDTGEIYLYFDYPGEEWYGYGKGGPHEDYKNI